MIGWLFGDFFLICGWLACAVWLVGWLARWLDVSDKAERAACISIISWQLLETAGEAKDGSPCHLGKSLEKEKRLFQLTIGDGLHSYPSMDVPTICFCRMLVNWPINIIIIIIFFIIIIIIIVLLVSLAHFHLSFSMSRKVHRKLQHNFSTRAIQKETSWDSQARAMEKETS